jgi:hypothetical protein
MTNPLDQDVLIVGPLRRVDGRGPAPRRSSRPPHADRRRTAPSLRPAAPVEAIPLGCVGLRSPRSPATGGPGGARRRLRARRAGHPPRRRTAPGADKHGPRRLGRRRRDRDRRPPPSPPRTGRLHRHARSTQRRRRPAIARRIAPRTKARGRGQRGARYGDGVDGPRPRARRFPGWLCGAAHGGSARRSRRWRTRLPPTTRRAHARRRTPRLLAGWPEWPGDRRRARLRRGPARRPGGGRRRVGARHRLAGQQRARTRLRRALRRALPGSRGHLGRRRRRPVGTPRSR